MYSNRNEESLQMTTTEPTPNFVEQLRDASYTNPMEMGLARSALTGIALELQEADSAGKVNLIESVAPHLSRAIDALNYQTEKYDDPELVASRDELAGVATLHGLIMDGIKQAATPPSRRQATSTRRRSTTQAKK